MTSPERLLYWIMILKKNIKNFQGFQGYQFWECFCFFIFFYFLPCFTSSNVKCMKSITSSVIPTSWSYESVLGQMVYQRKKTKQNTGVCCNLPGLLFGLKGGRGWQTETQKDWMTSLHCCLSCTDGISSSPPTRNDLFWCWFAFINTLWQC